MLRVDSKDHSRIVVRDVDLPLFGELEGQGNSVTTSIIARTGGSGSSALGLGIGLLLDLNRFGS